MHSKMQAKRGKDRLAIVYLNESRRKEKKNRNITTAASGM
jgi:hypothetical protein